MTQAMARKEYGIVLWKTRRTRLALAAVSVVGLEVGLTASDITCADPIGKGKDRGSLACTYKDPRPARRPNLVIMSAGSRSLSFGADTFNRSASAKMEARGTPLSGG